MIVVDDVHEFCYTSCSITRCSTSPAAAPGINIDYTDPGIFLNGFIDNVTSIMTKRCLGSWRRGGMAGHHEHPATGRIPILQLRSHRLRGAPYTPAFGNFGSPVYSRDKFSVQVFRVASQLQVLSVSDSKEAMGHAARPGPFASEVQRAIPDRSTRQRPSARLSSACRLKLAFPRKAFMRFIGMFDVVLKFTVPLGNFAVTM